MSGQQTIFSGEPGTSGREVFEDATAARPKEGLVSNQTPVAGGQGGAAGSGQRNAGEHGVGIGAGNDRSGEGHHHHSHHQHSGVQQAEAIGAGAGAQTADTFTGHGTRSQEGQYGDVSGATGQQHHHHHHHQSGDRTGNLDQSAANYDRTGPGGPVTGGAAGTDRFDSDRVRDSGVTGGQGRDAYEGLEQDRSRTHDKGTGGMMGALGTSDKDFLGAGGRTAGSGAYSDTEGRYQSNTSGPGGASALTGREGNYAENPVHEGVKGAVHGQGATGTHGSSTTEGLSNTSGPAGTTVGGAGHQEEAAAGEHKGFVQKIKDML